MTKNPELDQKVLRQLLTFLNREQNQNFKDNNKLNLIWNPETQSPGKLKIQNCLVEMLEFSPDNRKIAIELEPYKNDAIPVLVEAMNLKLNHFSMHHNAKEVLGLIGNSQAIPLILESFTELVDSSITDLLKKIAEREDETTRSLIINGLIKYLIDIYILIVPSNTSLYNSSVWNVINTIMELDGLSDPRVISLLEIYIKKFPYNSNVFQIALTALSKLDTKRAVLCLASQMNSVEGDILKNYQKHIKTIIDDRNQKTDQAFLTICVRDHNESELNEIPYAFKYEKPLVYFLKDAQETEGYKLLAGEAGSKSEFSDVALNYLGKWLTKIEIPNTKYQECTRLLTENLDLYNWGFSQSYIFPKLFPIIIYDSEWCRIRFSFEGGDYPGDKTIHLNTSYGRLHAQSDESFMVWNGEKCWCWHRIDYALNFLDGLSPEEASKIEYRPHVIEQYRNSEFAKTLSAARGSIELQSQIWKHYGKRLFELFDLRRPDLWEQFSNFMKEFQAITQSKSYGYPTKDKIC